MNKVVGVIHGILQGVLSVASRLLIYEIHLT